MTTSHRQDDGLREAFEEADYAVLYRIIPESGTTTSQEIYNVSKEACQAIARATPASRDGAEADQTETAEWNNGCDFAMTQLCAFLGVDPHYVSWDAATETVDGDVRAVIGNILRAKFGEDWSPTTPSPPAPVPPADGVGDTILEESENLSGKIIQTVRLADGAEVVRALAPLPAVAGEAVALGHDDVPMKWLIGRLRGLAVELVADPKTPWIGERDPKQHICWIAADRLASPPLRGEREAANLAIGSLASIMDFQHDGNASARAMAQIAREAILSLQSSPAALSDTSGDGEGR